MDNNNIITILNWKKYQSEYRRQKSYRQDSLENREKTEKVTTGSYREKEKEKETEKEKEKETEKETENKNINDIENLYSKFKELYKSVHQQPYPESKEGQVEIKQIQSFYARFENRSLWGVYSSSQYEHVLKLIELFFRMGPQRRWKLNPQGLFSKTDRLQLLLTKGNDGVYDVEKANKQKREDDKKFEKVITEISKSGGFKRNVRALLTLPERLHGRFRNWLQGTYPQDGLDTYYKAKKKYEQLKKEGKTRKEVI